MVGRKKKGEFDFYEGEDLGKISRVESDRPQTS